MPLSDASAVASDGLFTAALAETDPEMAEVIGLELGRQRHEIELIASENIVSRAVLEAGCRAGAITAAASSSTRLSNWRSTG